MPFCTIDPTETRAFLEDDRFDWLVAQHKPKSEVKARGTLHLKINEMSQLVASTERHSWIEFDTEFL